MKAVVADHNLSAVADVLVGLDLALVQLNYLPQFALLLDVPTRTEDKRALEQVGDVKVRTLRRSHRPN